MIHVIGTKDNRLILSTNLSIDEEFTVPNAYVMPLKNARGETVDILREVKLPVSEAIFYFIYLAEDLQNKDGDINPGRIEIRDLVNKAKQLAANSYLVAALGTLPPKSYRMSQLKEDGQRPVYFGDLTYTNAAKNYGPLLPSRQLSVAVIPDTSRRGSFEYRRYTWENPNVQIVYEGVKKKDEKTVYKKGKPVPAIVFGVEKKLSRRLKKEKFRYSQRSLVKSLQT